MGKVLTMLHGRLALVVISADSANDQLRALISGLAQKDLVDSVYVSLPAGVTAELLPATAVTRDGSGTLPEVLESIFEVPSADRLIDPSFPPIVVFASSELPLADLESAIGLFSASRRSLLVGLREVEESNHILLADGTIRAAFPRLVSDEPIQFVELDERLAIGEYEVLKALDASTLVAQLGWVIS